MTRTKSILILIAATVAIFGFAASTSNAGFFADIKHAIVGHVEDAKDRVFGEDMVLEGTVFKTGTIDEDAVGQDAAHWAKGTITIEVKDGKRYVQLGTDFDSGPLPDGHVYISTGKFIHDEADFTRYEQIDLGRLQLGNGASFYEIPSHISIEDINSVTIWCKRFGAYIGSANVG